MFEAIVLAALLSASTDAQPASPDTATPDAGSALLARADAPRRSFLNAIVSVRATLSAAGKPDVVNDLELNIGGEDRQLVVFKDSKAKGRKFLMRGDKSWLLVPGSKHPIAISANQRMLGNLSFADLARVSLSADYTGRERAAAEPCTAANAASTNEACRVIDISANKRGAPYASGTVWIDGRGLAVHTVFALASGKPARSVDHQYVRKENAWLLTRTVIHDLLSGENALTTTLDYLDHRRATFSDETFDPEYALTH